ncbi:MAG: Ig-like domain-containing protein [Imperialibacter sp.]|uniref:Ig-like domain-containing protein n=1 Tax=Imperialibacter sp. TaxID=2038411 RepID=UPI0032F05642
MKNSLSYLIAFLLLSSIPAFSQEWIEKANVIPTKDLADGDLFGASMEIHDDILVVGALLSDEFGFEAGAAYVFQRVEGTWVKIATLEPSLKMDKMQFGASVSIYNNLIAVGAPQYKADGQTFSGIVFLYEKIGTSWSDGTETCILRMSEPSFGGRFGSRLSINKDEILVGSSSVGHIFKKPATGWENMVENAKLMIPNGAYLGGSNSSLLLENNFAIIGAPNYTVDNALIGAAYYFEKPENGWETTDISTTILSTMPGRSMEFGHTLAVNDSELFISSGHDSQAGRTNDYIHIYDLPKIEGVEVSFLPKAILETVNTKAAGRISSIAASNDKVFVGSANGLDDNISSGLALIFTKPVQGWKNSKISEKVTNISPDKNGAFGSKIIISGTSLLVSDPMKSTGGGHGKIYTFGQGFEISEPTSILEFQVENATWDEYGWAVSISGNYAAIGSYKDDEAAQNAGAVYLYERKESGWKFATKIIPFDGEPLGNFGYSVSIYGNTLVVGSPGKNEGKSSAGAAYIYKKSPTGWSSDNAIKVVEPIAKQGGAFGRSVDIHKGKIIVTALYTGDSHSMGTGYIIEKIDGVYSISAELTTMQDPTGARWFGRLASIYEDEVVIGSRFGMFAFQANNTWHNMTETATLASPQTSIFTDFTDIDIAPGVAFFGHPRPALRWPNFEAGKVFVHENVDNDWTNASVTATLMGPEETDRERFGSAVSATANFVAVGNYMDSTANEQRGKTYLFKKPSTGWNGETLHDSALLPSNSAPEAEFGFDVSMYGHTLVVGAPNNDTESGFKSGSAFFYELDAPFITGVRSLESGPFKEGDIFQIAVDFNEVIEVTGEPYLLLEFDDHKIDTAFYSHAESQTVFLDYEAKVNYKSTHLDYRNENAFAGTFTITRGDAVEAVTVLPPVGTEESLTGQNIAFDFVAPELVEWDVPEFFSDENREVKLTFSEEIFGLSQEDFSLSNSSFVDLSGSGSIYYLTIAPTDEGEVTIELHANSIRDLAGNENLQPYASITTYDNTRPELLEDPILPEITNSSFQISLTFKEPIVDFTADDIILVNANLENFASTASGITFDINPIDDGQIIIEIEESSFSDRAGNTNDHLQFFSKADVTPPLLLFSGESPVFINVDELLISFYPSEKIKEFTVDDLVFSNCSYEAFDEGDNSYHLRLIPNNEGLFRVKLGTASFTDSIGNFNEEFVLLEGFYDLTSPEVIITTEHAQFVNGPFVVNFKFDEKVTAFDIGDINVTNGEIVAFNGQDSSYSVMINPIEETEIVINVPKEVLTDLAGNLFEAEASILLIYDSTAPTVLFELVENSIPDKLITLDLMFSEPIEDFSSGALQIENLELIQESWTENTLTVVFQPIKDGIVSVKLGEGGFHDRAENANIEEFFYSFVFDSHYPTVEIRPDTIFYINKPLLVTFRFDEPVTGFELSDIQGTNMSASEFSKIGDSLYTALITPSKGGIFKALINKGAFSDLNGNLSAETFASPSITFDHTPPTVTISGNNNQPINKKQEITLTFNEPVLGFDSLDVVTDNCEITGFKELGSNQYSLTLNPLAEGKAIITVLESSFTDKALNPFPQPKSRTFWFDKTSPHISFVTEKEDYTNESFVVEVVASEKVLGFDFLDVAVHNATFSLQSRNDSSIVGKVTPVSEGIVELSIDIEKLTDLAGNFNETKAVKTLVYDATPPLASGSHERNDESQGGLTITISFDEPVEVDFASALTIENFTIANLSVDNNNAYITGAPVHDGTAEVGLHRESFFDLAGNSNNEEFKYSFFYDSTPPSFQMIASSEAFVNKDFDITISLSEPVEDFLPNDVIVTNGDFSLTATDSLNYMLHIEPVEEGLLSIVIGDSVFFDKSRNFNQGQTLELIYDITAPTAQVTVNRETLLAKYFTVEFSEEIVGFNKDVIQTEDIKIDSVSVQNSPNSYLVYYSFPIQNQGGVIDIDNKNVTDRAGNGMADVESISLFPLLVSKSAEASFKIYPNPASSHLTLEFLRQAPVNYRGQIISLDGRILLEFDITETTTKIDLNDIPSVQSVILMLTDDEGRSIHFKKVLLDRD